MPSFHCGSAAHRSFSPSNDFCRSNGSVSAAKGQGKHLAEVATVGNRERAAQDQVLARRPLAETEPLDLQKSFEGEKLRWAAEPQWKDGTVNRLGTAEFAAYYVTRTITAPASCRIKAYLGSDDAITVWLNGKQVLSHLIGHWCAPDQETVDLDLQAGENRLTIKIANGVLDAAFYLLRAAAARRHGQRVGPALGTTRPRLSRSGASTSAGSAMTTSSAMTRPPASIVMTIRE